MSGSHDHDMGRDGRESSPLPPSLEQSGFEYRMVKGVGVILPPLCDIPAGPFLMGSDPRHDPLASPLEQPQREVVLPAFRISTYPLTVAEYSCMVHAELGVPVPTRDVHARWSQQVQRPDHPAVGISYDDAAAYARWLAVNTGEPWYLPSEAQWEKAARGTDGRIYPWGDAWDPTRANTDESGIDDSTPVFAYPRGASVSGVRDMSGNALEWTSSAFEYYPRRDGHRPPNHAASKHVLRGGSYLDAPRNVRIAFRWLAEPGRREVSFIGARLAWGRDESQSTASADAADAQTD
jgi:formylglycine-generating enzyme required for sulfatase activity